MKKPPPLLASVHARLDDIEALIWALHRQFHSCESWSCRYVTRRVASGSTAFGVSLLSRTPKRKRAQRP